MPSFSRTRAEAWLRVAAGAPTVEVFCRLGAAQRHAGDLTAARLAFRQAAALAKDDVLGQRSVEQQAREIERLLALEERLPQLLGGRSLPADPADLLAVAEMAALRGMPLLGAKAVRQALERDGTTVPEELFDGAILAAVDGGLGIGVEASILDDSARASWRMQSLQWLEELAQSLADGLERRRLDAGRARRRVVRWLSHPGLLRCLEESGAALQDDERQRWRELRASLGELKAELEDTER